MDDPTHNEVFNPNDTIVIDKEKFARFKDSLQIIYEEIESTNHYPSNVDSYNFIIKELNKLLKYYENELSKKNFNNEEMKNIISDRNKIIETFLNSFKDNKEFINYVDKETKSYFSMQKISQLSHGYGVFEDVIFNCSQIPEHIKHYLYLFLFLDSYESFAQYLEPFVRKIWKDSGYFENKYDRKFNTSQVYINLYNIYKDKKIILGMNKDYISNIINFRNEIAHSTVIIKDNKIDLKMKDDAKGKEKEYNEKDIFVIKNDIDIFLIRMILYATNFDIIMLKLYEEKDDKILKDWVKFYKKYYESWKFIG